MSAPPRDRAAEYAPAAAAPNAAPEPPAEPAEVRLVGVDAQVVSPAWELELIVTGIVLVGLFQIPPWLEGLWRHWEPHLTLAVAAVGHAVVTIVDAALYALIICFTVALALRGYWVALVGANSVFPHGVRWDKQREYGPIQAEIARRRVRPLPTFIGRANDVASMVFATGFVLAASMLASVGFLAIFLAVLVLLLAVLPPKGALVGFAAMMLATSVLFLGAVSVDMRRGARLVPGGRAERVVRALLRVASGLTPDGVRSLGAVLTSNVNKRVAYTAAALVFAGAFVASNQDLFGSGVPGATSYRYFTEGQRPSVVTADFYESLRPADDAPRRLPSIQSDVVTDPYVRLFVPYVPGRHEPALRRVCPTLRPPAGDDRAAAAPSTDSAVLACATRLHAVTLDGRAVAGAFHFFTNPRTERRGFLMLIPAASLAAGEHAITLQPARAEPAPADTAPIRIPFWK